MPSPPPLDETSPHRPLPKIGAALHALRSDLTTLTGAADLSEATAFGRIVEQLRHLGRLDLPVPGSGRTLERLLAFVELGAFDLSLARLAEGHADAVAILREAAREPAPRALYGVWAAEPPDARVEATRVPRGWLLRGRKRFCSGARSLKHALVTAQSDDGGRLFDVDLSLPGIVPVEGTWPAIGMAGSDSLDVALTDVVLAETAAVGTAGFYLERPGFWHGAVGVAACWLGGAVGAARMIEGRLAGRVTDEHQLAHFGAVVGTCASLHETLAAAARAIDADPFDSMKQAKYRALVVRQVVEEGCQAALARAGRATGTGPLVFDAMHARRCADLPVYLRQHHAERDLAALGRLALAAGANRPS